jgi:C1A family cysteine protease
MSRFGWTPDVPDQRDYVYMLPPHIKKTRLPASMDLRRGCPPIYDQGELGSCTANAIGAVMQFMQKKQKRETFMPSRLGIYYLEREMEGTVDSDAGAMLRDGIKVVNKHGVWPETMQPYDIAKFRNPPAKKCLKEGQEHQAITYQRMDHTDLPLLKGRLASGLPFVFGFAVYESFEGPDVARTGVLPMPKKKERMLGGHAVTAVGYNNAKRAFLVRNSWGADWGLKGHFWMPYRYATDPNLADDFWAITSVE